MLSYLRALVDMAVLIAVVILSGINNISNFLLKSYYLIKVPKGTFSFA